MIKRKREMIPYLGAGSVMGIFGGALILAIAVSVPGCEGGNPFDNGGLQRQLVETETRLTVMIDDANWEIIGQNTRIDEFEDQIANLPGDDEEMAKKVDDLEVKIESLPPDDSLRDGILLEIESLRAKLSLKSTFDELADIAIRDLRESNRQIERKVMIWETEREVARRGIESASGDPMKAAENIATAAAPFLPPPWNLILTTVMGVGTTIAGGIAKKKAKESAQSKKDLRTLIGNVENSRVRDAEESHPTSIILDRAKFIGRNDRSGLSATIDDITDRVAA